MRVVIKSIARQHLLSDQEYEWLLSNLNTPLDVMSIFWDRPEYGGKEWHISIYRDGQSPISLFVDYTEYELLW